MASEKEEIIYSIKIETTDAVKAYTDYTKAVEGASKAQKKSADAIASEAGSIAALREQNKKLTAERNATSVATEEGRKKVEALNKQLDENNKIIKENLDSYTKQKVNIGNYSGALDKLIPGLGATTNGLKGVGKEMWALVSNPIGATLAAIGLAFGALIKYFKGSEEGQNRLNQILSVGNALMEKAWDVVEGFGEAVYNAFTNPLESLKSFGDFLLNNIINRFKALAVIVEGVVDLDFKKVANGVLQLGTGVEDVIGKTQNLAKEIKNTFNEAIEQGNKLAALQAKIDSDERATLVETAKTRLEVAKLREKAVAEEGDQKRKTIEEAIALEKALADAEIKRRETKLEQARLELKVNGDDKDALMKVAEAEAAVIDAKATRFEATLRFQKELERLNDEERAKKEEQRKEDEKIDKEYDDRAWQATLDNLEREKTAREKAAKDREKLAKETAEKEKKIEEIKAGGVSGILQRTLGERVDAQKLYTSIFKKGALSETYANTKAAAIAAYKALAGIPIVGPILGIAAGAAATVYGLAQATGIAALQFERGGIARTGGVLRGPRHRDGGIPFTVAGRPGFEAEGGEILINRNSSRMFRNQLSAINAAGGGVRFADGGITPTPLSTVEVQGQIALERQFSRLEELYARTSQKVLVIEEFEHKQTERIEVRNAAGF